MAKQGRVSGIVSFLVYLYMLPAMFIFAPYYNWQYATSHGFTSWLFLGEIVPTAQSFIWPYYIYKHYTKPPAPTLTQEEKDSLQHISASINAAMASADISRTKSTGTLSDEDIKSMLGLSKTALREAQQVMDSVLDKIHPDFKQHFRNEYQRSLELRVQYIENRDDKAQEQGSALAAKWSEWVNAHKDEIQVLE